MPIRTPCCVCAPYPFPRRHARWNSGTYANCQEEYTRDTVAGADAWMWEEVEDGDGTQNAGRGSDGDSSDGNLSGDSVEIVD